MSNSEKFPSVLSDFQQLQQVAEQRYIEIRRLKRELNKIYLNPEQQIQRDRKIVNGLFLFTFNFPPDFIEQIWNGKEQWLAEHLRGKFKGMAGDKGYASAGDVCNFYTQLDGENRAKFADFVIKYATKNLNPET